MTDNLPSEPTACWIQIWRSLAHAYEQHLAVER
eukprot:COSAG01_NODE_62520_length_284_cov_0.827027_1_plen_32_part_10